MVSVRMQALHQVSPSVDRVVVINVATEVITSVAIASALRNLDMPLLVVNCTADGASKVFMDTLRDQWNFDLIDLPLEVHGNMLDRLFRELPCDRLTILDSDAEVTEPGLAKRLRDAFDDASVYGAGFVHPASWLEGDQSVLRVQGQRVPMLYAERPWIPFTMFRTSYVRTAIANGASFREIYGVGSRDNGLVVPPEILNAGDPVAIHGDTGAEIHAWLLQSGFRFDGPSVATNNGAVRHHHGVSRTALSPGMANATALDKVEGEALERLRGLYGDYWPGFAESVKAVQALSAG